MAQELIHIVVEREKSLKVCMGSVAHSIVLPRTKATTTSMHGVFASVGLGNVSYAVSKQRRRYIHIFILSFSYDQIEAKNQKNV